MRTIKINGKPFNIKFSYRAAKYESCVESAFAVLSGAMIMGSVADAETPKYSDFIKGTCRQVGAVPNLCDKFFYAGLLDDKDNEYRPKTEEEAGDLLIDYMEENDKNYDEIYDSLMECMKEDGFFEKSGIQTKLDNLAESMKKAQEEIENPALTEETKATTKTTAKKKATTK